MVLRLVLLMIITLFLYGIGAVFEYFSFTVTLPNYIIPIWNWSYNISIIVILPFSITLFLYGIGARVLMLHLIPL